MGCRPLSKLEIDSILKNLPTIRDKTIFIMGIYTGFRIQECLSLKVKDVQTERIEVKRSNMKGKGSSRSVVIHAVLRQYLDALITSLQGANFNGDTYLFQSARGLNRPIGRVQAWYQLHQVVLKLGLKGKIGLHSTRKTFADRVYNAFNKDILKTQKALGHKNMNSTVSYLSFRTEEIDEAVMNFEGIEEKVR